MGKIVEISPKVAKEVIKVGDDEFVDIRDLKVLRSTDSSGKKILSLGKDTFDKRIRFSKNEHLEVDASVVIFAGDIKENKVVSSTESIKSGYVIYKPGPEKLHEFAEKVDPFWVIAHTKKNGELEFSVVPEDNIQDIMKSHEKMKVDLHMHGIKINREGYYNFNELRKLRDLFDKSLSSDPKVREQGIDLTKWELGIVNPEEATKRMRLTLEIVLQDYHGISKAVEIAEQIYKFAHNPEVMKLIPPHDLPTFHEVGKIR
jgi:hypothetical protein